MPDPNFTAQETDEFTEEDDCENGLDCITQPVEPNDFVLQKLSKKKPVQYFVQLIQEMWSDGFNAIFLRKRLTFWAFFFVPKIEDPAAIDPTDIALKLPHQWGSGSICRKVTTIFFFWHRLVRLQY